MFSLEERGTFGAYQVYVEVIRETDPGPSEQCMLKGQKIKDEMWNEMLRLEIGERLGFCGGGFFSP